MKYAKSRLWMLLLLAIAGAVACDDADSGTEPIAIDEAQLLVDHVESISDIHASDWIMPASAVQQNVVVDPDGNLVIDIRSAEVFAAGHIAGAVNVAPGDVLTYLQGVDAASYDNIIIACYSGQTAAFTVGALRAAGYDNAVSLKWGMSGWHSDLAGSWNGNIGSAYGTELVSTASPPKAPAGDLPAIATGYETAEEILAARVTEVLAEGFGAAALGIDALWPDRDDYYIVNYWSEADYLGMGHLPGAIMYEPSTRPWVQANDLTTLPTDQPVVIYCYTGQTSALLTGYLRVLGYDVYSLKFGANGMMYNNMTSHTWSETAPMDYPLSTS